jgi:outer membrane immunogenic protein
LGYAFDRILLFATGGGAYGNIQASDSAFTGSQSSNKFGWTAGAGVEVALAPNWTAKLEYLYVNLGNGSCTSTTVCGTSSTSVATVNDTVKLQENLVRAGINYKFAF